MGIVEGAAAVAAVAAKHAPEADQHRRISPEVIAAIAEGGFVRHFVPREAGGDAGDFGPFVDAVALVAESCASAAWVAAVTATVGRMAAFLPRPAWDEVWSGGPDAPVVGALMPFGRATAEPGGYRLSGEWAYISGVEHSAWALVCGAVGGTGELRYFAVPRADYAVADTWFTTGLRGTGSNTLVAGDVFVPGHRTVPRDAVGAGTGSASAAPCHRAPLRAVNGLPFGATILGAVQGMRTAWLAGAREKVTPATRAAFAERLARVDADIDVARLLFARAAAAPAGDAGDVRADPIAVARSARDCAVAAEHLLAAADRLLTAGGSAIFAENSAAGRAWRDAHAAASHLALRFEVAADGYAAAFLA